MNALGLYKEQNGLTDDDVANTLSALLGKKITPQGVKLKSGKGKVPQPWAEALGLELGALHGVIGSEQHSAGFYCCGNGSVHVYHLLLQHLLRH